MTLSEFITRVEVFVGDTNRRNIGYKPGSLNSNTFVSSLNAHFGFDVSREQAEGGGDSLIGWGNSLVEQHHYEEPNYP